MRITALLPVVCCVLMLPLAGCIRQKIDVTVHPDGSGYLVLSEAFPRDMTTMIHIGSRTGDGEAADASNPFFNEEFLKRRARIFGSGVRFVKAREISVDGARGAVSLFAFKDINEVRLFMNKQSLAVAMTALSQEDIDEDMQDNLMDNVLEEMDIDTAITFSFTSGVPHTLTVHMPSLVERAADLARTIQPAEQQETTAHPTDQATEDEDGEEAWSDESDDRTISRQDVSAANNMLRQMRLQLNVAVQGTVLHSNASLAPSNQPQTCILYRLIPGNMEPHEMERLASEDEDNAPFLAQLMNQPGSHIETNRTIRIDFQ